MDIQNDRLVKTSWNLRSRRISIKILTKRRKRMRNKQFWNTVKPFLTSKGFLHNDDTALHIDNKTVTDCNELA